MANDFFSAFGEEVSGEVPLATGANAPAQYESSGQWKIWLVVFVALALAMIFAY
jgi:hypothetical protein